MFFLAAALQLQTGPDRAHNEARALALVNQAADRGAKLVALPEMWEHIGPARDKSAFAGPLEGTLDTGGVQLPVRARQSFELLK